MAKKVDYIIVGQGLAGTLMSYLLHEAGKSLLIIDPHHENASSKVAAGIINPITGRRFVKSWKIDTLIPFAQQFYAQAEQKLGIKILYTANTAMLFNSIKQQNDWEFRAEIQQQDISNYIHPLENFEKLQKIFPEIRGGTEFQQAGRIDMPLFLDTFRKYTQQTTSITILNQKLDYKEIKTEENKTTYKDFIADRIIFCEGYQMLENPFFNYLPLWPAKGEALFVKIPDYPFPNKMVKNGVFIIHLYEDIYWIGSSYERNYTNILPSKKEKDNLAQQLEAVLNLPFTIINHKAAIRPTVKDRKPLIGPHPKHKNYFIFNGLGAKGSYLGPYFAQQFFDFLEHSKTLDTLVDIQRYHNLFKISL